MKKLLWVGDAGVATGFAKVTHNVLDNLHLDWDISVLGVNYMGDPHNYDYDLYPCYTPEYADAFGTKRLPHLAQELDPDVIIIQNDPWNIPSYLQHLSAGKITTPVVAVMPVDGKNCRGDGLDAIAHAIFWTKFGAEEARKGGYSKGYSVIPLGVDTDFYSSEDKLTCRQRIGLPEFVHEGFIVGNINRNQPRKHLDLTIQYFCEWVQDFRIHDAFLFLHVCPTGDSGFDVRQLVNYYGLTNRLIVLEPRIGPGIKERDLVDVYNTFNVQMSTTQGEGWGLTTMEGMACGIPQIIPDWSALGEWAKDAAYMIPCPTQAVTPNFINAIGGIPDKEKMIHGLNELYEKEGIRFKYITEGYNLVEQPQYRWKAIAQQYHEVLEGVIEKETVNG